MARVAVVVLRVDDSPQMLGEVYVNVSDTPMVAGRLVPWLAAAAYVTWLGRWGSNEGYPDRQSCDQGCQNSHGLSWMCVRRFESPGQVGKRDPDCHRAVPIRPAPAVRIGPGRHNDR